jgi:hypothetical protein
MWEFAQNDPIQRMGVHYATVRLEDFDGGLLAAHQELQRATKKLNHGTLALLAPGMDR